MANETKIPYKIYLEESEMPQAWYNVRADMKNKPAPLLNPGTLQPMTAQELGGVFCQELVEQELDDHTPYIPIPQEIRDFYKMYRPSPLVRAYCLEEKLQTPAKIYYKFEGNNTSGSHKLNSAIAQAYYAKKQGLKGVTTETGAGQWGTALSMACAYLGLDCQVYMVKVSYEQKPFRREVMRTYGANVTPSPSNTTEVGRRILAEFPDTTGSLGCAISEAVEAATSQEGYRYVLGSVLNQVLLHQSVIGLETKAAMDKYGIQADIVIGCLPNTRETAGLLTAERLHAMKAGAVLVNVGRGSLAGTDDLVSALQDGHLGGAALDVFETEPLPADCPLWDMENVLLTPHIAGPSFGGSADVQNTIWHICMDNLDRYLTGNPLKNVVNRSEGY